MFSVQYKVFVQLMELLNFESRQTISQRKLDPLSSERKYDMFLCSVIRFVDFIRLGENAE